MYESGIGYVLLQLSEKNMAAADRTGSDHTCRRMAVDQLCTGISKGDQGIRHPAGSGDCDGHSSHTAAARTPACEPDYRRHPHTLWNLYGESKKETVR